MTTAAADSTTPKKLTPMMEQYRSVKKTLPSDTILFFRLGDFYEMFFEDALRSSEILNITLTGREAGEAGRVPMCGIPFHSSTAYIKTLIENNLKVAICEQIGDPKAKGLVERKVTRIISPATYLEDENKGKDFEYMAAVSRNKEECAIAFLELSTGEFLIRKVPAERMTSELMLLAPREIILSRTDEEDQALMDFVRSGLNATLTVYEDWVFGAEEGLRLLQEKFKLASKQGIPFCDQELALSSAGAVLYYLRDHLHASLDHVQLPALLESNEYMVLDRQTQRSLELVAAFSGEKGGPTLLSTIDQTLTSMGARTLYQWVTHPLLSVHAVEERQQAVAELTRETSLLNSFRGLIKGVKDIERTLSRLNYGVANARDLVNLAVFLKRIPEIRSGMKTLKSALLKARLNDIVECPELLKKIEKTIVEEPPLSIRDGGIIRENVNAELDELRDISANGKRWILDFQKREIERTGIKSLRMKYSQVFGYTIEISKSNLHLVPEDYIRRQTLANAERFIVPELKTWDEKISGAQDKIKALEYQLFNQLREEILGSLNVLQAMARAIGVFDCLGSLAMIAVQKNWVMPHVAETGELLIEGGRHPVVEVMLPAGKFVENDVLLDSSQNQLVVLTGPNMAGKSTYIRQTALIVLLAQIGSFVPAKSVRIGLVDRIFTRIGASDDLARGESTFMVEMVETAHILQKATNKSLLILDEVGRGTSTFDGVSIAWAICEYLSQGMVKPRTLFATHYHELTQLEDHFSGIKNYNITVRETKDSIMFLRKVVRGGSDRSYGIHVARLAGIPKAVTERAEEILEVLESENTEATQIIEGKKENGKRAQKEKREPTLFDFAHENHPVLEELKKLTLDGMTPLQALNKLSELKERLSPGK